MRLLLLERKGIMKKKWWHQSVVYQIYPKSFLDSNGDGIGDLRGIIQKLPYLQELGIDVLWLSPIYQSPMDDNGYDISDYRKIAPEFGSMEDFEALVEEGRRLGIRILMDLVVNHTSDEHPWFIESRSSKENPKRDWYIWRDPKPDGSEPNNWEAHFTRSAWEYDDVTKQYYLHLFSKKQPDLNWANGKMREAIYDMMRFWLNKGIGGFRMDTINMIGKPMDFPEGALTHANILGYDHWANHSLAHQYLREMHKEVLSHYDILSVGETPHVSPFEGQLYSHPDRKELDMIFQFEHMTVDRESVYKRGKPLKLTALKRIMTRWQEELYDNGWNSNYWSNHDQARIVSRFGNDTTYRVQSAKMLGTVLHMMSGTPYIYQGEESGLTNTYYDSIDDYNDLWDHHIYDVLTKDQKMSPQEALKIIRPFSRDNARAPIPWDDSLNGGFSEHKPWLGMNPNYEQVNVKQALEDEDSVFYHYKQLIRLRKESDISDVVCYGKHELLLPYDEEVYCYKRYTKNQAYVVMANFTEHIVKRELPFVFNRVILSNYPDPTKNPSSLILKPYECNIYEIKQ